MKNHHLFYAVAQGRKTGIFRTFEEANSYTYGYAGFRLKGFDDYEEAKKYIKIHRKKPTPYISKKIVKDETTALLYTDGGYNAKTKENSWAYIVLNTEGRVVVAGSGKHKPDAEYNMNNINGEINGVLYGIYHAIKEGFSSIIIYYDLVNLQKWGDNEWHANLPLTRAYKAKIKYYREIGITINFIKVTGHSGTKYNELCDLIAKHEFGMTKYDHTKSYTQEEAEMILNILNKNTKTSKIDSPDVV